MPKAMTVKELMKDLADLDTNLEVWLEDFSANEGYSPLVDLDFVSDGDPSPGDPADFIALFSTPAKTEPAWPGDR